MECCRLSLDPLEDACCPAPSPHLDLSPAPQVWQPIGSSGEEQNHRGSVGGPVGGPTMTLFLFVCWQEVQWVS